MTHEMLLLVGLCVLVGFGVQALAGFGGAVISLTLGAQVLPIPRLVPVIVALSLLQTGWLLARHHEHVAWRLLLRRVIPLMALGALAGLALTDALAGGRLELGYGVFVVLAAARELHGCLRPSEGERPPLPAPLAALLTLGAGVVHGIYASGGPLLVYVVGRDGLDKATFRSTLLAVWFLLNLGLLVAFLQQGRLSAGDLPDLAWLSVAVILALVIGEWGHERVDERRFRLVANALLLFAGAALLIPAALRVAA